MGYLSRALVLLAIAAVVALAQVNPAPSEAEIWAKTVLEYGDQSTATSLDKDLTALVFTKPESYPLFQFDYNMADTVKKMATVGASTFDNTRAIALTHPGQFVGEGVTTEFWDSVLQWVTYGNLDAKIAVGFASHQTFLQSLGATNVVLINFDQGSVVLAPADADVLIMDYSSYSTWSNARMDRLYQTTAEFIARDSAHGIVIGGESRFFKWTHYGSCSLFPANRVFAEVGIVYVCDWWGGRGFDMEVPAGNYMEHHLYHSLNYIKSVTDVELFQNSNADVTMEYDELRNNLRGSFVGCFCGGDVNAPVDTTYALHPTIVDIVESGNCLVTMPMGSSERAERVCDELAYFAALYSQDPNTVLAVPSSVAFPMMDETFSESDFVTATFEIDTDRCSDISTGIFVAPGRVVDLTIPQEWVGFVGAAVGQWKGNTAKFSTWRRNPNNIRTSYDLPTATTEIASGFGGMLYITVSCGDAFVDHFNGQVTGQIQATNVLKAVYFQNGITDQADWDAQLAVDSDRVAPWMELEVRDLIFTVPRTTVDDLSFDHVQEVADYWDYVTELYSTFRDKQPDEFKERGVTDAMVAYGYMYASYPMIGPLGESSSVFNLNAFYASGTWGWLHEIGHRYERGNSFGPQAGSLWNMFSGNVEVFTNVFTCQAIDGTVAENSRCSSGERGISDSLAGKNWSDMGPFQKLDFYVNQKLTFGWEPLTRTMTRGRTYRFPLDDIERRTRLWLLYSEEIGRNVRPMFDAWGIAVDENLLYEQLLLVDQVSMGIRFTSPMSDIGPDFADNFNVGAALLDQSPPDRLFESSASAGFGGVNNGDISGPMPHNTGSDMTVSFWLRLDSNSFDASIVEALDGGLGSLWAIKIVDNLQGSPVLEYSWPTGAAATEQTLAIGSWMHIAITTDSTQGIFYIDGVFESSFATDNFGSDPSNVMVFNYGGLLEGNLAEVGYFEAVLPADRVFAQWSPSPFGFAPWLTAGFMPEAPGSCPAHVLPQGIVACNSFDGIQNQPNSDCDACLAFLCDGAEAPVGVDCSNTCEAGFIVNPNGVCDECHPTCAECTVAGDSNACTRCDGSTGFPYAEGSTCVDGCSDGFTLVGDTCMPCDASCATCEGTSAGDCLSCDNLLFESGFCVASCSGNNVEHNGECLNDCPDGFFDNAGVCAACASSCETCSGAASNECLSCPNQFPFFSLESECLTSCPDGQYPEGFTCLGCLEECATCGDDATCTTCDQGGATPWFFEFACLAECPDGTTPDVNNFVCDGCDINGEEPFDNEGECVSVCPSFSYQHQCVNECPSAHYADENNDCKPCDTNCQSCETAATTCTSCNSGSAFPFLLDEQCLQVCPDTHYADGSECQECDTTCETCEGPSATDCTSCASALPNFLEGACLEECPDGFFSDAFQCRACEDSCLTCSGALDNQCDSCHDGDLFFEGACVNDCPSGTFATTDGNVDVCLECNSRCLTCNGEAESCTSCDPNGDFPVHEGFTCVEACDGFDLEGECVTTCPDGYFEDGDNCSLCDIACQSCEESATNCLVCNSAGPTPLYDEITEQCLATCAVVGRFGLEGVCVSSCPPTFYADATTSECRQCEEPCNECEDSATTCTACGPLSETPYLLGDDCVSECPIGFYETTSYCLQCHSSCESCDAAGATSCTGCSFGFVLDPSGACVEEQFEDCPDEIGDLQSTSAVASWPDEHSSVSQDVLCLDGTSINNHCIPYGSRIEASIDVEVALTATILCAVCDNDNLLETVSKTVQQDITVSVETARSLRFLNSLLSAEVVDEHLEELFEAASIDNTLNVHVISLAEQQFEEALASAGLEALCSDPSAVIELSSGSAASQQRVELAAVGELSDEVCPFPETPDWNDQSEYQARCICDDSVDGIENPCAQLDFAPFSQSSDAICHPVACTVPETDEEQWIVVTVELDTNFFAFGDADTKEILSEIINFLQLNTDVGLADVFLTRLDIGSVVMTLIIDSSDSFDDDYNAAEVLVDDLNSADLSLSVPVIMATVVTPNNPPSDSYSTIETDSYTTVETDSYTTVETDSYTTVETDSYTTVDTNSFTTVDTNSFTTVDTNSFTTVDTNSVSTADTSSSTDRSSRPRPFRRDSSSSSSSDDEGSSDTASSASSLAVASTLVVLCAAAILL